MNYTRPPGTVDPQELRDNSISESAHQAQVVQAAADLGWHVHHHDTTAPTRVWVRKIDKRTQREEWVTIRSRQMIGPGFPDLILVHPQQQRVIFAELKVQDPKKGKRSENQVTWGGVLEAAGQEYYLWRPSDWGEIVAILSSTGNGRPP